MNENIREILVVSLSNLGDVILTTPVITTLHEHYPKAFISVVVGPKAESLFRGSATIDQVVIYNKKGDISSKTKFIIELRKRKYDLVVDLRNTLIPYLVQTKKRTGPFMRPTAVSMRERHLSRLNFLNIHEGKLKFDFFSEGEVRSARQKLLQNGISWEGGFVVLAPGAGNYFKRWPAERFREAANHFLSRGKQVVIVGSPDERELGKDLQGVLSGRISNLCGVFSLRELAAVLNDSEIVLCCDSGIMHLANELNAPVVALFGPTDEKKYAKFGPYNRVIKPKTKETNEEKLMKEISTEEVIQACEELLSAETH